MANEFLNQWDQPESDSRLELVFADRFKEYGAYLIRSSYRRNKFVATMIACGCALLFAATPVILAKFKKKEGTGAQKVRVEAKTLDDVTEKEEEKPLEPPPPDKPEPVATQQFIAPRVDPNTTDDFDPPPNRDIKSPGAKTQEGNEDPWGADNGSGGSPFDDGKGDSKEPLTKVENEALFPGGDAAFIQFIQDNFEYPPRCLEEGIGAVITMRFVVDVSGKISRIYCTDPSKSCPEFTDEAIRVLKRSPRWIPANNNGKFVTAWRSIPINLQIN